MTFGILIFGATFSAFTVWLVVRIVNRRERWAKLTLVTLIGPAAFYILSFGPASWLLGNEFLSWEHFKKAYRPVLVLRESGPPWMRQAFSSYSEWCRADAVKDYILVDIAAELDAEMAGKHDAVIANLVGNSWRMSCPAPDPVMAPEPF